MPWSPVPKIPAIIKDCKEQGAVMEVSYVNLEKAIMRQTGATKEKTILDIVKVMVKLDFLEPIADAGNTWRYKNGK